jgi:predicted CxxxxCH...CXXCH cytochrome family protein
MGDRAFPPRDSCLFPSDAARGGAHAAHVLPGPTHAASFPCTMCHPSRTTDVSGSHGDGVVDVAFDVAFAGPHATYEPTTATCVVACHARGGRRPAPSWFDTTPMTCNDCHASPPSGHPAGTCTACHAEPDAAGTTLRGGPLHMNGRVDVGDGSGTCAACHHGASDAMGWPDTGSHLSHRAPANAAPVACSDCHAVPSTVSDPVHFVSAPSGAVRFSGNATVRGAAPSYDTGTSTCAGVACHGAGLGGASTVPPAWGDTSGAAVRCGRCHGLPPPAPHTSRADCESVICHGGEVAPSPTGPAITPAGRALHQNGVVDHAGPGP